MKSGELPGKSAQSGFSPSERRNRGKLADHDLQSIVGEIDRRAEHNRIADEVLFDKQIAFIRDPSKRKAVFCPRRSGKSFVIGILLLQEALAYPRRKSLYIGLTGESAHGAIFADIIAEECRKRAIKFHYNHTTRVITFRNGSTIKLAGMDSSPRDMDKLLGGKYHLVVIDEAQGFTQDLRLMIHAKLGPAMADYVTKGGGIIVLAGTPGSYMGKHYWHQVTKQTATGLPDPDRERGWNVHEWTVPDNPHMREQFAKICEDKLALYGPGYQAMPEFQREWLGKWVLDAGSKVYKFDNERNVLTDEKLIRELINGSSRYTYIMGVDLGWEDATALSVCAYSDRDPNFYVIHTEKVKHMVMSQLGATLAAYGAKFAVKKMVLDTGGGASKQLAMSMQSDFALPIFPAEKHEKEHNVGRMNSDFLAGRIKVITAGGANAALIAEWDRLTLNRRALEEDGKWKVDEKFDDHVADCVLYAWRQSLHQFAQPPKAEHPEDTASRALAWKRQLRPIRDEEDMDLFDRMDLEQECRDIVRRYRGE